MSRFPSIKHATSETRRLLRDRFYRKLRVHRQTRHLAPDAEVVSDRLMLRLLQGLDVTFEAEWTRAEAVYAAANPSSAEPKDLKALADAGWVRAIWGRVAVARDLRQAARRATTGPMVASLALYDRVIGLVELMLAHYDSAASGDCHVSWSLGQSRDDFIIGSCLGGSMTSESE